MYGMLSNSEIQTLRDKRKQTVIAGRPQSLHTSQAPVHMGMRAVFFTNGAHMWFLLRIRQESYILTARELSDRCITDRLYRRVSTHTHNDQHCV